MLRMPCEAVATITDDPRRSGQEFRERPKASGGITQRFRAVKIFFWKYKNYIEQIKSGGSTKEFITVLLAVFISF